MLMLKQKLMSAVILSANVMGPIWDAFNTQMKPQIISAGRLLFTILSVALAIALVATFSTAGLKYKKHGESIPWEVIGILFFGLVIAVSASAWVWGLIGW